MPKFIATFRAMYEAEDDVAAILAADIIRENGAAELDEGGELIVTQVTSSLIEVAPEESIIHFERSRDLLIKTRIRQCFDMAREFDKMIYVLRHRNEQDFNLANYDYGAFMDRVEELLIQKK